MKTKLELFFFIFFFFEGKFPKN